MKIYRTLFLALNKLFLLFLIPLHLCTCSLEEPHVENVRIEKDRFVNPSIFKKDHNFDYDLTYAIENSFWVEQQSIINQITIDVLTKSGITLLIVDSTLQINNLDVYLNSDNFSAQAVWSIDSSYNYCLLYLYPQNDLDY